MGEGKDTLYSSVSFDLLDSQEVETMVLSSVAAISGTGNLFANIITMTGSGQATLAGEGGNDVLTGGSNKDTLNGGNDNDVLNGGGEQDILLGADGNDRLNGGEGNDLLAGGAGIDAMLGGKGNDVYVIWDTGDTITELFAEGHDTVSSQIANYILAPNVEDLTLAVGAVNGTGNTLDNVMTGNNADNKLDGGVGVDWIEGRNGDDTIIGGLGHGILLGEGGNDTLRGGTTWDVLVGGAGADLLIGDAGGDVFIYQIDDKSELATLGNDKINGFQTGFDRIELTDLLETYGIDADDAFSGGFVRLTKSGSDTLVQFDVDGAAGAASPLTMATAVNATVAADDLMVEWYATWL